MLYEKNSNKDIIDIVTTYRFIDVNNSDDIENSITIIGKLMSYNLKSFDEEKKEERLIVNVLKTYDYIMKQVVEQAQKFTLPILADKLTSSEEEFCYEIVERYLKDVGVGGKIIRN